MRQTFKSKIVYKIGADPELFVETADGKIISAHNLIPGDKHRPYKVELGALQPDGTAAEFNIDPATTVEVFQGSIKRVLQQLQEEVQAGAAKLGEHGVHLRVIPTVKFDEVYFKSLPIEALAFGCSPDFNAWTEERTTWLGTDKPMRTGGGHIHVGWTNNEKPFEDGHWNDCVAAVKQLDATLFIPSLLFDTDHERRSLYGALGSFRPKPYGVEYRPLSNMWVSDPALHAWVFTTTKRSMELLDQYDVACFNETDTASMLGSIMKNGQHLEYLFNREELIKHHKRTAEVWGLPTLPARYLEA